MTRAAAHRTVMPSVIHSTRQYANNRAEVSHQPTRQRERQMRRFTSAAHAQRFLSVHGLVLNLFRVGRHLLRSTPYGATKRPRLVWVLAGRPLMARVASPPVAGVQAASVPPRSRIGR